MAADDLSQVERDNDSIEIGEFEKDTRRNTECILDSNEIDSGCQHHKAENNSANQQEQVWTPPNGGYGWVCVATVFLINANTWGLNSSYGVFLAHYLSHDTFRGATRIDFAFVGGLSISQALLISPIATSSTRIFGTKTTLLIGIFFQAISFVGASFAKQTWQLFLSQGVCFGWGLGFLFVGSVGVVPQWFTTRRSLANGIGASGSGFGGLAYSLATNSLIQTVGLQWAFRVLGILAFVMNFICAILLKDRNKQLGASQLAFDIRLFKRFEFWALLGFGVFSMLGYVVLLFSLPNYANHVGLTAKQASVVGAILNLGQGLGRPPIGYFSDVVGRINMAASMTFLSALFSLVMWTHARSFGVLIAYGLIGGPVAGTYWATVGPVTAEIVGLKELPAALSITWFVLTFPTLFSEPIGLEIIAKNHGHYLGAQLFCGMMYLAAAACLWYLKAWKIGQLERLAATENNSKKSISAVEAETTATRHKASPFLFRLFRWEKV